MTKDLQEKAVDIKGKKYVLVADRILFFNETYPNGAIQTQLLSDVAADHIVIKAKVIPDLTIPDRFFTGHSQAIVGKGMVNATAALENAETSAIGRALGMMGIGVIDSIASIDEINKAKSYTDDEGYTHEETGQKHIEDTKPCLIHEEDMHEEISSKTNKPYWSHFVNGKRCFGGPVN